MFRRKNRDRRSHAAGRAADQDRDVYANASSGPSSDEDLGRRGVAENPFELGPWLDMVQYGMNGWSVIRQGLEIQVYGPGTDDLAKAKPYVFALSNLPVNQWIPLGYNKRRIPIAVRVQADRIFAMWLPLVGDLAPLPKAKDPSKGDSAWALQAGGAALRARNGIRWGSR